MKTLIKIMSFAAVLTLAWGCSSSDDDENNNGSETTNSAFKDCSEVPRWQVNQSDNQPRPQWTSPDPSKFENKMIVLVRLQDELVPYSTDDDMMAVFVDNECRALSIRSGNEEKVFFVLNVHANAGDISEHFQLCYYSGGLKQLFVLNAPQNTYLNERTVGVDSDFSPTFTVGSTKYSVKTPITVNLNLINGRPVDTDHDLVGVFVDDECRGVGKVGETFIVFNNSADEPCELCFFSWAQQGIFTIKNKFQFNGDPRNITFEF